MSSSDDHTYRPSEHDGLKKDGTPDKRVNSEHGFGGDHERASELGKKGGHTTGHSSDDSGSASNKSDSTSGSTNEGGTYKPSEHDGLKADGTPNKGMKDN